MITSLSLDSFNPGKEYKRSEIHDIFGGNRQRGISVSKDNPVIFIFSGKSGVNYGYEDGWQDETIFYYTGEGQVGDQDFKEGNKALRDHLVNGKNLLLFEKSEKSGFYEFINQFNCTGYHIKQGPDKNGQTRMIIKFELQVVDSPKSENDTDEFVDEINNKTLDELRQLALNTVNTTQKANLQLRKVIVRIRAAAIKRYALLRANGICESCNKPAPFVTVSDSHFLEVHHLNKLSDGGLDHPINVAAVCPNCHRRVHYGKDGIDYNNRIKELVLKKENYLFNPKQK